VEGGMTDPEQIHCDNCGKLMWKGRSDARWCSAACHYDGNLEERRRALKFYREHKDAMREAAE
jgi:hypothetical protein